MLRSNKVFFYVSLLFFAGILVWAVLRTGYVVARSFAVPSLVCEEPTFDFGTINLDQGEQELVHEFVFSVKGKKPVTIKKVAPGCGSQIKVVEYPKTPIKNGEQAKVILKLPTVALTGQKNNVAVLQSDDWANPDMVLSLKVSVQRPPEVNGTPPTLAPEVPVIEH
ncbi:hypothetical protein FACS189419_08790 [Planctomycetales bacterium]|nr:hypothetical protein FACS189419_08790 [Planctomycetales bacterium]